MVKCANQGDSKTAPSTSHHWFRGRGFSTEMSWDGQGIWRYTTQTWLYNHNHTIWFFMIINMHTRRIIGEGKNHCKIVSWNVSWTSWTSLSEFCWQALAYNWPTQFYRISTECCPQFTGNGVTVSRGQRVHDRPVYPDKVEGPGKGTMTWSRTMRCLLNGMKLWNNWI